MRARSSGRERANAAPDDSADVAAGHGEPSDFPRSSRDVHDATDGDPRLEQGHGHTDWWVCADHPKRRWADWADVGSSSTGGAWQEWDEPRACGTSPTRVLSGSARETPYEGSAHAAGTAPQWGPLAPPIAAWRRVVHGAVASESSRSGADRIDNLYGLLRDCWRVDRDGTRPVVPRHLCDQFWAEVAIAKEQRRARDQLTLAQRRPP